MPRFPPFRQLLRSVVSHLAAWVSKEPENCRLAQEAQLELIHGYFTQFLPRYRGKQWIPGLAGVDVTVRFCIQNQPPLVWEVSLADGKILEISPGSSPKGEVTYETSPHTFLAITSGQLRAEQAFLTRQVKISGNYFKGLKLAVIWQTFFTQFPYLPGKKRFEGIPQETTASEHSPLIGGARKGLRVEEPQPEGWVEEKHFLLSSEGEFEVRLAYPETWQPCGDLLLAPPHPLLGATVENQLLRYVSAELAADKFVVTRFGYSLDIGKVEASDLVHTFWSSSDTEKDLGVGNLLAVWEWLWRQSHMVMEPPESRIPALAGYSYGAQVILKALNYHSGEAVRPTPNRLILISPVVSQLGEEIKNAVMPTLLISASNDFASTPAENAQLADKIPGLVKWIEISGADHFYRGHLAELVCQIKMFLLKGVCR